MPGHLGSPRGSCRPGISERWNRHGILALGARIALCAALTSSQLELGCRSPWQDLQACKKGTTSQIPRGCLSTQVCGDCSTGLFEGSIPIRATLLASTLPPATVAIPASYKVHLISPPLWSDYPLRLRRKLVHHVSDCRFYRSVHTSQEPIKTDAGLPMFTSREYYRLTGG